MRRSLRRPTLRTITCGGGGGRGSSASSLLRVPPLRHPPVAAAVVRPLQFGGAPQKQLPGAPRRAVCGGALPSPSLSSLPPPPDPPLAPRVAHFISEEGGTVASVVAAQLGLAEADIRHLARMSEEAEARRAQLKGHQAVLMKPRRVTDPTMELARGHFLRVHVHPKRFPAAHAADWEALLVEVGDDYVVVNKPAGVSVGPTVDNSAETCAALAGEAVGSAALSVLHRLDVCTSGVLVMGRTKPFTSYFNKLLRKRKINKTYRTLSLEPPPVGVHTHWAEVEAQVGAGTQGRTTRRTRMSPAGSHEGGHESVLEVLQTQRLQLGRALALEALGISGEAAAHLLPPGALGGDLLQVWESVVRLETGRTHQIRAQFEALGAPLVGDTLYTPGLPPVLVREPDGCIGLQAWRLELQGGGGDHFGLNGKVFEAPDPWWRE